MRRHPALAARVPELRAALKAAEHQESINEVLARQMQEAGLLFEEEFRFRGGRGWRFDFAFPRVLLAVEIEGINHRRRDRYARDLEKYNAAARLNWCVLRFTAKQVHAGTALYDIRAELIQRRSRQ